MFVPIKDGGNFKTNTIGLFAQSLYMLLKKQDFKCFLILANIGLFIHFDCGRIIFRLTALRATGSLLQPRVQQRAKR